MQTRILTDKEYQQLRKDAKVDIPFAEVTRSRRQWTKGEVSISLRHSFYSANNKKRIDAVRLFLSKRGLVVEDQSLSRVVKVVRQYSLTDNKVKELRPFFAHYARYSSSDYPKFDLWESGSAKNVRAQYADAGMGI